MQTSSTSAGRIGLLRGLIGEHVSQRRLCAFDLGGDHGLLPHEPVQKPVRAGDHRAGDGQTANRCLGVRVEVRQATFHAQRWVVGRERERNEGLNLLFAEHGDSVGACYTGHRWSTLLYQGHPLVKISYLAALESQVSFTSDFLSSGLRLRRKRPMAGETPRWFAGAFDGTMYVAGSGVQRELASLNLLEPGVGALLLDFPQDLRVEGRVGRLAVALPRALGE